MANQGPLTAEEIAELRNHLERGSPRDGWGHPMRHGDEQSRLRDLERAARAALPRLLDEVERARALLKRIEWGNEDEHFACPECDGKMPLSAEAYGEEYVAEFNKTAGHRPGCELAALIGPEGK